MESRTNNSIKSPITPRGLFQSPIAGIRSRSNLCAYFCLEEMCHHRGPRSNSELGEYSPQMRAYSPGADIQNIRYHLVWMSPGYHSHDLLFTRTEVHP